MVSLSELAHGPVLPPIDLLRVIDRLPAELRAKVRWVRPVVRRAVEGLRSGVLTPERLDEAALALCKPTLEVMAVLLMQLSRDEVSGALNEASAALSSDATAGLDSDSVDTFRWSVAMIDAARRLLATVVPLLDPAVVSNAGERELREALANPLIGGLLRGQTLLLAAVLEPDYASTPQQVTVSGDLIAAGFLHVCRALDVLRAHGVVVDPFDGETRADRAVRALTAVTALREALSDEDSQVLAAARLQALR